MADTPINLNKVRKARARAARKREADRNAVVHGMPKADRKRLETEAQRWRDRVDGTRRDGAGTGNTGTGSEETGGEDGT